MITQIKNVINEYISHIDSYEINCESGKIQVRITKNRFDGLFKYDDSVTFYFSQNGETWRYYNVRCSGNLGKCHYSNVTVVKTSIPKIIRNTIESNIKWCYW